jgi:peptide/nickel transport system permease protein
MSIAEVEALEIESTAGSESQGSLGRDALRRLVRSPVAIIGLIVIAIFLIVAIFAPLIAPHSPTTTDLTNIRPGVIPGPSSKHLLGVDQLGRDELSRILFGARDSLLIGVVSMSLGAIGGAIIGTFAGGFGGWVDSVLMRFIDILLAIPGLLFAIGVAALLQPSLKAVMIAIGVVNVPVFARLLRGSMLAQRNTDYVLAARAIGVKRRRIVFRHILPNSLSPVIVQATLSLATAIIDAAGLAYLGLGSQDPGIPEWGRMLADSQNLLASSPQLALIPGAAIVLAALGFNLVGDALREALDPKLRR